MKNKPLEVDDANPCMKCGSVQCAFCSEDVRSAVKGHLTDVDKFYLDNAGILSLEQIKFLIDKWFPCFKE